MRFILKDFASLQRNYRLGQLAREINEELKKVIESL